MAFCVPSQAGVYMSTEMDRKLFTVDDYSRMEDAGILRPEDRVELIRGEIVKMSPIGPRHMAAVDKANRTFVRLAGDDAIVRIQGAVVLDRFSAPEPDIVLLRPRDDFYASRHAGPPDILLIIEVADTSLAFDTTLKAGLYAILKVPEYWIADLQENRLLCYSEPQKDSYRLVREFHRGDMVAPLLLPNCRLNADILLPC
jgi:Uma2 family endonuclease